MNACSCLTLILACIVYWQAREISRLAAAPDFPFDPDLLRHVSPIEWKNIGGTRARCGRRRAHRYSRKHAVFAVNPQRRQRRRDALALLVDELHPGQERCGELAQPGVPFGGLLEAHLAVAPRPV